MKTQTEMNVNHQDNDTYIGVDVAKETLDAYRTHDKAIKQFPNSKEGFKQFLKWCKETPPIVKSLQKNLLSSAICRLPSPNRDSGKFRGQRRIRGGRSLARTALYMAAQSVVKCVKADKVFKQLYLRITKNRPHKVGIIAVAHKILIIAHSMIKNNVKWQNRLLQNVPDKH